LIAAFLLQLALPLPVRLSAHERRLKRRNVAICTFDRNSRQAFAAAALRLSAHERRLRAAHSVIALSQLAIVAAALRV
tara:strand:+ start:798 stop:1031 length:234 start_codon:yes stop_codon:yes gene_type:complete